MTTNKRPYRQRVELVIWKRNKILITINPYKGGVWYGLPGGGVDGDDLEEAVRREALEEVGIAVKELKHTGFSSIKHGYASEGRPDRQEKYGGSETHLYEADYDKLDHSLYNKDGDAVDFVWMSSRIAYQLLKKHFETSGGSGDHSYLYLEKFL